MFKWIVGASALLLCLAMPRLRLEWGKFEKHSPAGASFLLGLFTGLALWFSVMLAGHGSREFLYVNF
jgi:hypothetical protein